MHEAAHRRRARAIADVVGQDLSSEYQFWRRKREAKPDWYDRCVRRAPGATCCGTGPEEAYSLVCRAPAIETLELPGNAPRFLTQAGQRTHQVKTTCAHKDTNPQRNKIVYSPEGIAGCSENAGAVLAWPQIP